MPQPPTTSSERTLSRVPVNPAHTIRQVLTDEESYSTTLVTILIDTYGTEALEWHPATIKQQLEGDFNIQLPQFAHDRIMAAVTLLTTDFFYQAVDKFIDLCNVLGGSEFDPGTFDPADSYECAWGITEALLLSPPEEEEEPFSDDIRRYIGFVLHDEGFVTPPDVLKIALDGDFADQVRYDLADDPEMFEGVYQMQADKTGEVTTMIKENLTELMQQLQSLPLTNGDTSDLVNKLRGAMKRSG